MSNNKMLIDATHPEETRVVVLRGGRVEEFDFESAARKLLRGNIYLAKVTRVEPSLQAAFVEYGGNRHGFLAFNEIHPDYYQIPVADRQALLEEEAAAEAAEEAAVDAHAEALARRKARGGKRSRGGNGEANGSDDAEESVELIADSEEDAEGADAHEGEDPEVEEVTEVAARTLPEATLPADDRLIEDVSSQEHDAHDEEGHAADEYGLRTATASETASGDEAPAAEANGDVQEVEANGSGTEERVEQVGSGEDALEELPVRPRRRPRSYKIQEVIKRRQVILVQVVKEERGNKGAALTTYLSLAGRYTVLMPNTARGGGISRKITNPQDRKRLKAIAAELEVPEGMGLIIRTAGAARTKQEIKRDFEYLLRLWESVRDLTLQSQAPNLVYEEGNLIKRSIRDLYNKDVDEVIVAGNEAHREAKDFMRMLMPSHAKNVTLYQEPEPLFTRFQIERQLNAMFSPYVTLRSGGYLVINQTEALVAIDVNSGKATREFSIEETALNTNIEAADEIARQLKLRDLAGLIVIDFIDMEEKRNNRAVERRLKEALRFDRARIQVGRISHFGLMEMSRQRLRTGVLEGSTSQCPHCQGTGIIRSTESVALAVLRGLEDAIMGGARTPLIATTTPTVALYILNNKRPFINDMEARHGMPITVTGSDKMVGANFTVERGAAPAQAQRRAERTAVNMDWGFEDEVAGEVEGGEPIPAVSASERGNGDEQGSRRRRRRRRRGGRRGDHAEGDSMAEESRIAEPHGYAGYDDADAGDGQVSDAIDEGEPVEAGEDVEQSARAGGEERRGRNRRRGRRGGRRGRERQAREHAAAEGDVDGLGEQPDVGEGVSYDGFAHEHEEHREHPHAGPGHDERASVAQAEGSAFEAPAFEAEAPGAVGAPPAPEKTVESMTAKAQAPAAATQTEAPPTAETAPEPLPQTETPAPTEEQPTLKRARHRTGASEPRLQRIVVGKDEGTVTDETPTEEAAAPARKGWWQRRLGGE